MRTTVKSIFMHTGVPMNLRGIKYIEVAIELLNDKEWEEAKLMSLYRETGKHNNASAAQAERCMRYAFNLACDEHDEEVREYFDVHKRTVGNLLYRMFYLLKGDNDEN